MQLIFCTTNKTANNPMVKHSSMDDQLVDRLFKIIDNNLQNEQFGPTGLARQVGLSKSQLNRRLKTIFRKPVSQLIREYRLKKAMEFLRDDVATAAEVAYMVGFSSPNYFNTCFHEYYGYPPGQVKFKKDPGQLTDENESHKIPDQKIGNQTEYAGEKLLRNTDEPAKIARNNINGTKQKSKILFYPVVGTVVLIVALLLIWKFVPDSIPVDKDKSIAVLPFRNESNDPSTAYFVNGMMDDIISNLIEISDLRVIPRTTMEKFRGTKLTASEIASAVGVSYLLEGSAQKLGDLVKIHAKLIDAGKDDHIWHETYNEDISDIVVYFETQSNIAKTIAKEIGVNIGEEEGEQIDAIPTSSPLAYDYYLMGKDLRYARKGIRLAIQMFEKAVELDSSFALAWAGLAQSNRRLYSGSVMWSYRGSKNAYFEQMEQLKNKTRHYLDKAIHLAPELKEVRLVESSYYAQCERNPIKALQVLEKITKDYPKDASAYARIGNILRGTGECEKGLEYLNKAISLNPSHWGTWNEAGRTLRILRKYDEAEAYFKEASALHPHDWFNEYLFDLYINNGAYRKAIRFVKKDAEFLGEDLINRNKAIVHLHKGDFKQAIHELESMPSDSVYILTYTLFSMSKYLFLGMGYDRTLNEEKARENYSKVKELFEINLSVMERKTNSIMWYAFALAGLGMKEQAIDTYDKIIEIQSYSDDVASLQQYLIHYWHALLYVMVGKYDEAINKLIYIIDNYGGTLSVQQLKDSHFWKPLRDLEGFKAIINNPEFQVK